MEYQLEAKLNTHHSAEGQSLLDLAHAQTDTSEHTELEDQQRVPTDSVSDEFPEGGLKAWAAVCGSFCIVSLSQGGVSAFGVYQDFYTRIFLNEHSPSEIAWIGSTQIYLIFALGFPTGKLFDDGYFRHLIIIGCTIYVFSYFMLSLAKPHNFYQVYLAQGVGVGIGMGLTYVPAISLLFHYFKRRRILAAGIASVGSAVGAICQTIGLNHLFNGPVGFAWGVRIFGGIFLLLSVTGILLMHPRLPPRKLRKDNLPKPDFKRVVKDIPLSIANLGASLIVFAIYFPFFYIQLFAILHGIPTSLAFYTITILNGCSIFGRVFFGGLADRVGPLNVIIGSSALLVIVSFSMIKATTERGLIAFTIFYGLLAGSYFALAGPSVSSFIDNTNELGFAFGYTAFMSSFFVLIAQPIAGQVVDAPKYKWNNAIIFVSTILLVGCILIFIARTMLARRKKTWKV